MYLASLCMCPERGQRHAYTQVTCIYPRIRPVHLAKVKLTPTPVPPEHDGARALEARGRPLRGPGATGQQK